MSGRAMHSAVRSVRRFFWLPGGTPRHPARPLPLLRVWLFLLAVGAGGAALGLEWEGTFAMLLGTVYAMLDDVIEGVRHRWPAFVAASSVGWAVDRLAYAAVPAVSDALWGEYAVHAVWTLACLATFVAISRLPPWGRD
ncbi:hypothetical protein ACQEV2_33660 [Streptomyces sp. CA-251387]|uniref:hypothetical protein n=1 Tax=Streptomyces sp. CA-251387 TaxID=3240064 RepID=UPI003D942071